MCTLSVHRVKCMETLRANVGRRPHRHCQNLVSDQTTVMMLLSRIPEEFGGSPGRLNSPVRPGYCADDLYEAILKFQKTQVRTLYQPDGIVEPGGATLVYMNRLADLHMPLTEVDFKTQDEEIVDSPVAAKYPAVIQFGNFTRFLVEKDQVFEFKRPIDP